MKKSILKRAVTLLMALSMFFVLLMVSSSCSLFVSGDIKTVEKTDLNGDWTMARVPDVSAKGNTISDIGYTNDDKWFNATVPGTVLTSYYRAGLIPDPYYSDNMLKLDEDYYNVDYWYRKNFTVPDSYKGRRVMLNFDGINWKADIFVNGQSVGKIEGAFIRGQFDITDYVKIGEENSIAVYIHWCNSDVKDMPSFLCSNSWDWMPKIPGRNMGIYKDVYLTASGGVTVDNPYITTDLNEPDYNKAEINISTDLTNHTDKKISGTVMGTIRLKDGSGKVYKFSKSASVPAKETVNVQVANFDMKDPKLWWPNGLGDPNLYTMNIYFKAGKISDSENVQFGVREYSYEYEPANVEGNTPEDDVLVYINGEKVFCRGGNWGIPESMLAYTYDDFDNAVRLSKEEGFTMIRCWHGTSGFDAFYDACDKYGIMVYDEFWLNGPDVPNEKDMFMDNVEDTIKRIRNRASLAIWGGANEITPPGGLDIKIQVLLTDTKKCLDKTRIYISASNSEELTGGITYQVNDLGWYFTNGRNVGFTTEYGCVSVWNIESMRNFLEEKDLTFEAISNAVWDHHETDNDQYGNKQWEKYKNFIFERYGQKNTATCSTFEDFCRNGQLLNYETYKAMQEAWNINMFKEEHGTSGTLQWMSHQGWPGLVWTTYDYYMEENGAFFGTKSANEAIHVQYNYSDGQIDVINNTLKDYENAVVTAEIYNMDGSLVYTENAAVSFKKSSVTSSFNLFTGGAKLLNNSSLSKVFFIRLKLQDADGNLLSENNYWRGQRINDNSYQNYTDLKNLGEASYSASYTKDDNGERTVITLTLKNESANVAFGTRIKAIRDNAAANEDSRILPTFYSDNYFYLLPGESKTVTVEYDNEYLMGGNAQISVDGFNTQEHIFAIQ